jgi:hydrogenase expression/formation protein HypE
VSATAAGSLAQGPACPTPLGDDRVQLGHGSGGKLSAQLVRDIFLPHFGNPVLGQLGDAAVVPLEGTALAVSTDTFVVSPIEFPGGNIGTLAVHGTVNDLAMQGARPRYLTAGFVLEEGLPLATLERVVAAMAAAAREAGVLIVAGDTKVVERGRADGLYVNTTGIGALEDEFRPAPDRVRAGDVILASGAIGRHGMAVMAAREGLSFRSEITSDTACLSPLVERLRGSVPQAVHALRDPTRGGVASALNELAFASGVGVELEETTLLVPPDVRAACEVLGLDPLYVANEGMLVAFVAPDAADAALDALRSDPLGRDARAIGRATVDHPRLVVLRTALSGSRVVDLLPGDQLPRIC